ncbi:Peptide methionine sulfoxide reductase A5 [Bienertia sinuspersici]
MIRGQQHQQPERHHLLRSFSSEFFFSSPSTCIRLTDVTPPTKQPLKTAVLLLEVSGDLNLLWLLKRRRSNHRRLCRSIIFTNGTSESRLAAISKEKEQIKSKNSVVTTQIQPLGTFYPAEPEHQEELEQSTLAAKLNSYAAELCPRKVQNQIDSKINDIVRKGWPVLKEI